jgi:hypothetical protein
MSVQYDICQVDMSDCHELDDTIFQSLCDGQTGLHGYNGVACEGGSPNLRCAALFAAACCQRCMAQHAYLPLAQPRL